MVAEPAPFTNNDAGRTAYLAYANEDLQQQIEHKTKHVMVELFVSYLVIFKCTQ